MQTYFNTRNSFSLFLILLGLVSQLPAGHYILVFSTNTTTTVRLYQLCMFSDSQFLVLKLLLEAWCSVRSERCWSWRDPCLVTPYKANVTDNLSSDVASKVWGGSQMASMLQITAHGVWHNSILKPTTAPHLRFEGLISVLADFYKAE